MITATQHLNEFKTAGLVEGAGQRKAVRNLAQC